MAVKFIKAPPGSPDDDGPWHSAGGIMMVGGMLFFEGRGPQIIE